MKKTVKCLDGMTRIGEVVYVHPEGRFEVLRFDTGARETFYLPIRPDRLAGSIGPGDKPHPRSCCRFTPSEIQMLRQPIPALELAKKLGRSIDAIRNARSRLKRGNLHAGAHS